MKTLQVTVSLESCNDCRHIDHNGSFTVRGARLICGHSDACEVRISKTAFRKEYPEYKKETYSSWNYHWIHRVLTESNNAEKGKLNTQDIKSIPDWCPLKHGAHY